MIIEGQWVGVFNWNRGKVSFNAPPVTSSEDPVMAEALKIASMLAAGVRGDEGETYGWPDSIQSVRGQKRSLTNGGYRESNFGSKSGFNAAPAITWMQRKQTFK